MLKLTKWACTAYTATAKPPARGLPVKCSTASQSTNTTASRATTTRAIAATIEGNPN